MATGQNDWSYTWNRKGKVTDPDDSIISPIIPSSILFFSFCLLHERFAKIYIYMPVIPIFKYNIPNKLPNNMYESFKWAWTSLKSIWKRGRVQEIIYKNLFVENSMNYYNSVVSLKSNFRKAVNNFCQWNCCHQQSTDRFRFSDV